MLALARPQFTMGHLPAFPHFAPLDISHQGTIEDALAVEPPEVSELNFAETFAWHEVRQTRLSDLGGAICLFITRYGRRCFYPPLGAHEPAAAMRTMLLWLRAQGEEGYVYGLTGRQAAVAAASGELLAEEDPDNADYVYRTQDLIHLPGHNYDGKRNHIRNFTRSYRFAYAALEPRALPEVIDFQRQWFAGRRHSPGHRGEGQFRDPRAVPGHEPDVLRKCAVALHLGESRARRRQCRASTGQALVLSAPHGGQIPRALGEIV